MKYVIGVDAGGTKTEAVAYNLSGQAIANSITGFGNLVNNTEVALSNIESAVKNIVSQLNIEELEGIYIGAAGSEVGKNAELIEERIKSQLNVSVYVMNDAEIALKAMLKGEDGILTIAGTGSIAFGINNGVSEKSGGWGNLLGDEGSGYKIAICAIQRMIKEVEDDMPQSQLTKSILDKLEIKSVNDITEFVYSSTKDDIASLTPIVSKLGNSGDEIAKEILSEQGIELAKAVERLFKKLKFECCSVALVGGVIRNANVVREAFEQYLRKNVCINKFVGDEISPTKGAYYIYVNNK